MGVGGCPLPWCLSQRKEAACWIKVQMLTVIRPVRPEDGGYLGWEAEVWVAGDRRLGLRGGQGRRWSLKSSCAMADGCRWHFL